LRIALSNRNGGSAEFFNSLLDPSALRWANPKRQRNLDVGYFNLQLFLGVWNFGV
jgi:hypothetical protein